MEEKIKSAAKIMSRSQGMVISTGAGISRESGIPTFRGEEGLWNKYRPEELASREGFLSNPSLVWKWYRERLLTARDKEPNPGHYALAELEDLIPNLVVVTQNIDNLHRRAGSRGVVELHGNIERYRCLEHSHPAKEDPTWEDDKPPLCHCGSIIRPDVVWFGEPLPQDALECAFDKSSRCDTFLLVGTSCLVQPAATLPLIAKRGGASLIEINIKPSHLIDSVDILLQGKSGKILPKLVNMIKEYLYK
jgi:NAD-dependent deacetylase